MAASARWCAAWLALCLAMGCASGQEREGMPSPYLLREEIVSREDYDILGLYRSLGLPLTKQSDGATYPIRRDECSRGGCEADVYPIKLARLAHRGEATHALVIGGMFRAECRIIFFRENLRSRAWSVLGHLDAYDHYGVWFAADDPFRLQVRLNRGTGVAHTEEQWYEVDGRGVRQILQVLRYGTDSNIQPSREFRARQESSSETELTYIYSITFRDFASRSELFQERRRVVFARPSGEGEFTFDASRSQLTQAELATFFRTTDLNRGSVDPPPSKFLQFASTSLRRMARSGSPSQKTWLRNYLASAPESAIKSELLRALEPRKR